MSATFLNELNEHISAFAQATADKQAGRTAHIAARAALDEALGAGLNAVRQLDAVVRNKYRDDPATLAQWTSASHTPPRSARLAYARADSERTPLIRRRTFKG